MSGLRILAAFLLSAVLFIAMGVVEEYETFFAPFIQSESGPPAAGQPANNEKDLHDVRMVIVNYNDLLRKAGINGVIDILDSLPATEEIIKKNISDLAMAKARNLPRPVGKYSIQFEKVQMINEGSARAFVTEDWLYGDSFHSPRLLRAYRIYLLIKIDGRWIIEKVLPDPAYVELNR